MKSETELKTLKDFEKNIGDCVAGDVYDRGATNWIKEDTLKAEAVKWVKEKTCNEKDIEWIMNEWIKHFFNLTEEDLK